MSLWIDSKYANLVGARLPMFSKKGDYLWNYRCVVCGDSKKNKLKARGYIYRLKTGLVCKCHNCGYSANIGALIKYVDPQMYHEYVLENYAESGAPHTSHSKIEQAGDTALFHPTLSDSTLDPLKRIDNLSLTHPAVQYVIKRKIPSKHWHLLYFCTRFKRYVNSLIPDKFRNVEDEHPRLIIPYFNSFGKCFAFQGRAFGKEDPKYYTIKLDDQQEKIYGLDRINYAKPIYIVEGPLDSLFLPNCIAVSGSSFDTPTVASLMTNATVVYDNEPRSPELTKLILKTINKGYKVCLWPDTIVEKDINEMVLAGMHPSQIQHIIDSNTYEGLIATMKMNQWSRV